MPKLSARHNFDVEFSFTANGADDPYFNPGPLVSVARVSQGVFDAVLQGSGPLTLRDALVQVADSRYRGSATQTGDRTFRLSVLPVAPPQTRSESDSIAATLAAGTSSTALESAAGLARLVSAAFTPSDALTADNTDFVTLSVEADAVAIASVTTEITGSGDWTADVPVPIPVAATPFATAGQPVTLEITKDGVGVATPSGTLDLVWADAAGRLIPQSIVIRRPSDAAAADEDTQRIVLAPAVSQVVRVVVIPDAALTASDTDFATLSLLQGATVVASQTTEVTGGSGDWVAGTPVSLTIDPDEDVLLAEAVLSIDKATTGNGVDIPASAVQVDLLVPDVVGVVPGISPLGDPYARVTVRLALGPQNIDG